MVEVVWSAGVVLYGGGVKVVGSDGVKVVGSGGMKGYYGGDNGVDNGRRVMVVVVVCRKGIRNLLEVVA